jgi:hypothetical protein
MMTQLEPHIVSIGERNSSFYGPFPNRDVAWEFAKLRRNEGIQAIVYPLRPYQEEVVAKEVIPVQVPLLEPVEQWVPPIVVDRQPVPLAVVVGPLAVVVGLLVVALLMFVLIASLVVD